MTSLRRLAIDRRMLCAWLIAATLLMRMLVPAGFMPSVSADGIAITLCGGNGPVQAAPMHGMSHHDDRQDHQGKDMPCGFMALSAASLAAVDPLLLAGAIAFVLAAAFFAIASERVVAAACFRPPLRGPPVLS